MSFLPLTRTTMMMGSAASSSERFLLQVGMALKIPWQALFLVLLRGSTVRMAKNDCFHGSCAGLTWSSNVTIT